MSRLEGIAVAKSFRDWFAEGEAIYAQALSEYQALESQLEQLESRLSEQKTELNQIAQMIGKPPVQANQRLSAQLIEHHETPTGAIGAVTRALTGRGLVAR